MPDRKPTNGREPRSRIGRQGDKIHTGSRRTSVSGGTRSVWNAFEQQRLPALSLDERLQTRYVPRGSRGKQSHACKDTFPWVEFHGEICRVRGTAPDIDKAPTTLQRHPARLQKSGAKNTKRSQRQREWLWAFAWGSVRWRGFVPRESECSRVDSLERVETQRFPVLGSNRRFAKPPCLP